MAARTRRIILPERVLGMSGTTWMDFGRAILPIMVSMVDFTLSWMALVVGTPGFSEMYTTGTRPLTSSTSGTTAASAISPMVRQADSTSLVTRAGGAALVNTFTAP